MPSSAASFAASTVFSNMLKPMAAKTALRTPKRYLARAGSASIEMAIAPRSTRQSVPLMRHLTTIIPAPQILQIKAAPAPPPPAILPSARRAISTHDEENKRRPVQDTLFFFGSRPNPPHRDALSAGGAGQGNAAGNRRPSERRGHSPPSLLQRSAGEHSSSSPSVPRWHPSAGAAVIVVLRNFAVGSFFVLVILAAISVLVTVFGMDPPTFPVASSNPSASVCRNGA